MFRAETMGGADDVTGAFNAARDDEYAELIERCDTYLRDLENHTATGHFTYPVLEESDDGLTKLRKSLEKIRGRDLLAAGRAEDAADRLERCAAALAVYSDRVYREDTAQPAAEPTG